jgi:nitrogen regulatory protein PII
MNTSQQYIRKLLTIITEAAIEDVLVRELDAMKVTGYTITNARGKGSRGTRNAGWETSSNIRIEIICDSTMALEVSNFIKQKYYDNYAMILFITDVEVLRPEKF